MRTEAEHVNAQTTAPAPETEGPDDLVRVFWIDRATGQCGNGEPVARKIAEPVMREAERNNPHIQHWMADA